MSTAALASAAAKRPHAFQWQQTMLRVKDAEASLKFYRDTLGFTLIHKYDFTEGKFSLYFLATLPEGEKVPGEPGSKEAEAYLWSMPHTCIELTHNHGTEKDADFSYDSGNNEPHRGFGHIAIFTDDVYKTCDELEKKNVSFRKKPDEGRMKGLAFAYDPDGYWVEIIKRSEKAAKPRFTLAQTMLRIKDPKTSLDFYRDHLGMTLCRERHFGPDKGDFSLYFLAHLPEGVTPPADLDSEEASEFIKTFDFPVLELTHNHGTEKDESFSIHNGNSEPRGFGHIGFLCDDLDATCADLESKGVKFQKKPTDGKMRGLAFALDPDGYWIEIIGRGLKV